MVTTENVEANIAALGNLGVFSEVNPQFLVVPEGVKMISRPELTIAAVVVQEEETATPVAEAAAPAAGAAATPAAGAKPTAGGTAAPAAGTAKPAAGAKK